MITTKIPIRLMDRGRVSKQTRGFANLFVYEGGFPPFNMTFPNWI